MNRWLDRVGDFCRRVGWPIVALAVLAVGLIIGIALALMH